MTAEESETHEEADTDTGVTSSHEPATAETSAAKLLKGKEKAGKGPLRLLDLPVDILKEIIHQVSRSGCADTP